MQKQERFRAESDNECFVNTEPVGLTTNTGVDLSTDRRMSVRRVCGQCGGEFTPLRRVDARHPAKFCSLPCSARNAGRRGIARLHELYPQQGSGNFNFKGWRSKNPVLYTGPFKVANPEKVAAHRAVQSAVRAGWLIRPEFCESCLTRCKPHAHHDDYSKPLIVDWLCRKCHKVADSMRRARETVA